MITHFKLNLEKLRLEKQLEYRPQLNIPQKKEIADKTLYSYNSHGYSSRSATQTTFKLEVCAITPATIDYIKLKTLRSLI